MHQALTKQKLSHSALIRILRTTNRLRLINLQARLIRLLTALVIHPALHLRTVSSCHIRQSTAKG